MPDSRIDVVGLNRVEERVSGVRSRVQSGPRLLARSAGEILRDQLKAEAPARSGRLRDSITFTTSVHGEEATVRFRGAWYAHFLRGTKAHDIWAGFYTGKSDKRFLFFSGTPISHVRHPGEARNDWIARAYAGATVPIREALGALGRVITR